ncbi:hypothetical protein [uncultured Metabacillus sp.]|uniref:hypothetical protein n=1 Tax=uncultured Metabacillus sp. TaxID=2860135 RepID=UPI00260E3678|nr:hypothetical protein [uncultured Metabacillus sp.]
MAATMTLVGLAGCGDEINEAEKNVDKAKEVSDELEKNMNDAEQELQENGVGDGVDQDNGPSDGEQKDVIDDENKNTETN